MAYDSNLNPEEIVALAREMEGAWANQSEHDERVFKLVLPDTDITVWNPPGSTVAVKAVRAAHASIAINLDVASLLRRVFMKVVPRSSDNKDQEHADNVLEPWLQGCITKSQVGPVLQNQIRDLLTFDRSWGYFSISPRLWASKELRAMVDEYEMLTEELVKRGGLDRELNKDVATIERKIGKYKGDTWPLLWKYVDARSAWPVLSDECKIPEVIVIRDISLRQAKAEYGDAIPVSYPQASSSTPVRLYTYSNWVRLTTIMPGYGKAEDHGLLHDWEHNLGRNPYSLWELSTLPTNALGIRWKSRLWDYKDILEMEDRLLSELNHLVMRETGAEPTITLNPQLRNSTDPKIAGDPNKVVIRGTEGHIRLWTGEEIKQTPTSTLNPHVMDLLRYVNDYVNQVVLDKTRMGEYLSGTSSATFMTAYRASEVSLHPAKAAIIRGLTDIGQLAFRSVQQLAEEHPGLPAEKLTVIDEGYGAISVGAKDVDGWEAYIQPILQEDSPYSPYQKVNMSVAMKNLPLHPARILEDGMGMENALDILEEYREWRIDEALMDMYIELIKQRAGGLVQETAPGNIADLAERISKLPPAAIQGLAQAGVPEAQQILDRMRLAGGAGEGAETGVAGVPGQLGSQTAEGRAAQSGANVRRTAQSENVEGMM